MALDQIELLPIDAETWRVRHHLGNCKTHLSVKAVRWKLFRLTYDALKRPMCGDQILVGSKLLFQAALKSGDYYAVVTIYHEEAGPTQWGCCYSVPHGIVMSTLIPQSRTRVSRRKVVQGGRQVG